MDKKKIILFGGGALAVLILFVLVAVLALKSLSKPSAEKEKVSFPKEELTLVFWGFEDPEVYKPFIQRYQARHKNVKINYVQKTPNADYEKELMSLLAEGAGPDIFMVKNDWLPRDYKKLSPLPEEAMQSKDFKSKFTPIQSAEHFEDTFVPAVSEVCVYENKVYCLPFSLETLALIYNPNLFDQARVEYRAKYRDNIDKYNEIVEQLRRPPKYWDQFEKQVQLITKKEGNKIIRAGCALGTANNVDWATEILTALMLQNKTQMVSTDLKTPTFNLPQKKETGEEYYPGADALHFYTSFANPKHKNFSWQKNFKNSIRSFYEGKVAMILGYPSDAIYIKQKNPELKFGVTALPQVRGEIGRTDFVKFWATAVNKNSKYPQVAWHFINFIMMYPGNEVRYQLTVKKPLPFKELHRVSYLGISNFEVFSLETKTAKTWYKGIVPDKTELVFTQLINNAFKMPIQRALDKAASDLLRYWQSAED